MLTPQILRNKKKWGTDKLVNRQTMDETGYYVQIYVSDVVVVFHK